MWRGNELIEDEAEEREQWNRELATVNRILVWWDDDEDEWQFELYCGANRLIEGFVTDESVGIEFAIEEAIHVVGPWDDDGSFVGPLICQVSDFAIGQDKLCAVWVKPGTEQ